MVRLAVRIFGDKEYEDAGKFARVALGGHVRESSDPLRDISELRRTGKTHQAIMRALELALNSCNEIVIVLSNNIMESDRKMAYGQKILSESFPKDWSSWTVSHTSPKYMLKFKNGSSITFAHAKEVEHVHSGATVIDDTYEAADVQMMRRSSRNTAKDFIVSTDIIKLALKGVK